MSRRSASLEPHTFTVEGSGFFPYDMLRYDECYPHTEAYDSVGLSVNFNVMPERRRVVLRTRNPSAPTHGRWDSFGWQVVGSGEARDPAEHPTPPRRR